MRDSYQVILSVAIEAALEAGALLRADFLKPGGPSGAGYHADADERAEWLIRRRVLEATPGWGYRGEETGYVAGVDTKYLWLVDPNDGTSAYLKGWRGSAVSIGLLRGGFPILGVVYAFAAPDNDGDLFAWAEGCRPLQRNGLPIERVPWPAELTAESISLISQSADRAPRKNLACVAPGRYLAVPSIAYRLALAAAGDGQVAVGLSEPGAWDYGGGHALVRGTQGDLVDEDGRAVTYTADGLSKTVFCFGGAPALVREVAGRPWWEALAAGQKREGRQYSLCRPVPGGAVEDNELLLRAQGCWLGQLAGDALGSMVEFRDGREIHREYPHGLREIGPSAVFHTIAGQPTDDSELALMLAHTLVHDGVFDDEHIADAYAYWLESAPFDVGTTTITATRAMVDARRRGVNAATAGRRAASRSSEANGALMRQSPLALWGHALDDEPLATYVRRDTTLTHPSPVCQDASTTFIIALAAVIREGLDAEAAYCRAVDWNGRNGVTAVVAAALAAARSEPPHYERNQGHVPIALQNAFYQALHAPSMEAGIVATVMGGGDTDTNAAIAGALLGAIHGARAVPAQWRQAILTCRPAEGAIGVRQPRSEAFWPCDALVLAERLVVARFQ